MDLGVQRSIGAVATQGNGHTGVGCGTCPAWLSQYKLGTNFTATDSSFSMITGVLSGNADATSVVTNYVTPFAARYVRLYPWTTGRPNDYSNFPIRVELYAVVNEFDFSNLTVDASHGAVGSTPFCTKVMHPWSLKWHSSPYVTF